MGRLLQTLQKNLLLTGSMSETASSHKGPHIRDQEDHPTDPALGSHLVVVPCWRAFGKA